MRPNLTISSVILLAISLMLITQVSTISPDNACTFHLGGKLFSLLYLQKDKAYNISHSQSQTIYLNFCAAFVTSQCPSSKSSYSLLVTKIHTPKYDNTTNQTIDAISYNCTRYSSNSYGYYFSARYIRQGNGGTLQYIMYTEDKQQVNAQGKARKTEVYLQCSDDPQFVIDKHTIDNQKIVVYGKSKYGCPVFQVSSIWSVFQQNWILIGIVLFVMGLQLLFFGRTAIQTTIFIATFLIIFAVLGAIFTLFVSPYSSTFVIYFAFLLLLFASTLMAYGVTKLVNVSIFFVGAILGFIVGMLVNSLFCSIFNVYSVWSLVVFQIVCTIPFGLLAFKERDYIIIASSSLTGSYLIVRPISWVFGGFPNQFLLYQMVQTKQLNGLPWVFFLYLILIIALAIIGAMYQLIKLRREHPENQMEINFIQQSIEQPIDSIKMKVDKLIERFKSDKQGEDYRKMSELKQTQGMGLKNRPKSQDQYPKISQFQDVHEQDYKKYIDQVQIKSDKVSRQSISNRGSKGNSKSKQDIFEQKKVQDKLRLSKQEKQKDDHF